jgi:hypothetical protein
MGALLVGPWWWLYVHIGRQLDATYVSTTDLVQDTRDHSSAVLITMLH